MMQQMAAMQQMGGGMPEPRSLFIITAEQIDVPESSKAVADGADVPGAWPGPDSTARDSVRSIHNTDQRLDMTPSQAHLQNRLHISSRLYCKARYHL